MTISTQPVLETVEYDADQPNHIVVIDVPVEVYRSYDASQGDERRFDREEAIARARHRATARGHRQQVRRVRVQPGDEALTPVWLIQDI